jgi:hypothetical protein
MEYLGAWGTLIHEKNLKSKISCQTPFKRDNASRFSTSGFLQYMDQFSPLGPFEFFSKICGDIRSSRCTTSVVDKWWQMEKICNKKFFY